MSFIYDRLYGKLEYPQIISKLLNCPGLLRLREIGMGNINFFSFPSFSAVNRYEHSLGVCHLAELAADSLELPKKDKLELMIAALYHDVTTPPFAHATEELFESYFGFNHEKYFYNLLIGKSKDLGGSRFAQIYYGRSLKLISFCQSAFARKLDIDFYRIINLVFGNKNDPLSNLICSDIDLDNIDNVIRAASAMGIRGADKLLAESLSRSFVSYNLHSNESIAILESQRSFIIQWKALREILYDMIFCSVEDFSLQTMLKDALSMLINGSTDRLNLEDWNLTEPAMIEKINSIDESKTIYKRMQLKDLYPCIKLVWLTGKKAADWINNKENRHKLEVLASDVFGIRVITNFYHDKRQRKIEKSFVFFDQLFSFENSDQNDVKVLLGFFTSENINYKDKKTGKIFINREKINKFTISIRELVPKYLQLFEVNISQKNGYPHMKVASEIKG